MFTIGSHKLLNPTILAPMAGVTDRPFRILCKKLGAGMAVSEMVASNSLLRGSKRTQMRADHIGESSPRSVQIVGADPNNMALAAKINADNGAEIIDINMGCPAKKICNTLSGSALLRQEKLVSQIIEAVVSAVDIPVTLKIRTGWSRSSKNGLQIAKMAQDLGIKALAVHGRTREDFFKGEAEYDTIAEIKANSQIPIIANGDINCPVKAKYVLDYTKADGIMLGRAAQGNPWIFKQITNYLTNNTLLEPPSKLEIYNVLIEHLHSLFEFYGEDIGSRVARKHVAWYTKGQVQSSKFRSEFMTISNAREQIDKIEQFFLEDEKV